MPQEQDLALPFWEHAQQLRSALVRSLIAFSLALLISSFFAQSLLEQLLQAAPEPTRSFALLEWIENSTALPLTVVHPLLLPQKETTELLPGEKGLIVHLPPLFVALSPQEGFLSWLQILFWSAYALASPYILLEIARFIRPALTRLWQQTVAIFLLLALPLGAIGIILGLRISLPIANHYFYLWNAEFAINQWSVASYIHYAALILFAHSVLFELGALLLFLVHIGTISAKILRKKRRHAIVGALILGALLTPPDVFTQLMIALPAYGFYELAILYGTWRSWRQRYLART